MKKLISYLLPTNLISLSEVRIQKLILQTNSSSGYEREAALIELKRLGSPQLLPILICRLNDWVRQVSQLANELLLSLLKTENQAYFIEALPAIMHLEKCDRRDHSHIIAAVTSYLLEENQRASLINAIQHKNQKISWLAFRLCKEHKLLTTEKLLLSAIQSHNINIIRNAVDLIEQLENSEFLTLTSQLIRHKCNAIASTAIKRLNFIAPQEIEKISSDLIFSHDVKVRAIAKVHLINKGGDILSIYRLSLNDTKAPLHKRKIALIGIHETFGKGSIDDLMHAKTNTEPSIRAIAISRLVEMLEDEGRSIAIAGIIDESPTVVRAAASAFVKQGFQLSVEELLQLERTAKAPNSFNAVMFLAKKGDKWNHIILLLELTLKKPDRTNVIEQSYGQWMGNFNIRQTQPTKEQVKTIIALSKNQQWTSLKFIMDTLST